MKVKGIVAAGIGFLCFSAPQVNADVVELRDGSIIRGKIAEMDSSNIKVATDFGLLVISLTNVKSAKTDSAGYVLSEAEKSPSEIVPAMPVAVSTSNIIVSSEISTGSVEVSSAPQENISANEILLTVKSREVWGRVEKRYFLKDEEIATRVFTTQGKRITTRGVPDCTYKRNNDCLFFGEGDNAYYVTENELNMDNVKTYPQVRDDRFHVFIEPAYFSEGGGLDSINESLGNLKSRAIYSGYVSAASNSSLGTGWGIRAGILKPISKSFDWGFAFDYIREPKYSYSLTAYSPAGNGYFSGQVEGEIWRITTLLKGKAYIEEKTALVFGLGLGWNSITVEENDTYAGTFVSVFGAPSRYSESESRSGGTLDASVGISRLFDNGGELEFGIRLVRFYYKGYSSNPSIWDYDYKWKPTSIYLSYKF